MHRVRDEARTNGFGLRLLGLLPEILSDPWTPHDEAPGVQNEGPRVVRGGAEAVAPWQACGEWHLLLNAMRTSSAAWPFWALRVAVGVRVAVP